MSRVIRFSLRVLLCTGGFFLSWLALLLALGKPPATALPILAVLAVPWLLWNMTAKRTNLEKVRRMFNLSHNQTKAICNVLSESDPLLPLTVRVEVSEQGQGSYRICLIGKTKGGRNARVAIGQLTARENEKKWPPSTISTASGENRPLEYFKGRVSESCWEKLVLVAKLAQDDGGEKYFGQR